MNAGKDLELRTHDHRSARRQGRSRPRCRQAVGAQRRTSAPSTTPRRPSDATRRKRDVARTDKRQRRARIRTQPRHRTASCASATSTAYGPARTAVDTRSSAVCRRRLWTASQPTVATGDQPACRPSKYERCRRTQSARRSEVPSGHGENPSPASGPLVPLNRAACAREVAGCSRLPDRSTGRQVRLRSC